VREEKRHIIFSLLKNIRDNDDHKSFEELFRLLYPGLLNFCTQFINNKEQAEEIVSDVFAKLWITRKETVHIKNPETYLFITVKNRSINYLKQFSHYQITFIEDTGELELVNYQSPERELEKKELIFKMTQAIDSLPKQCKIIFNLVREEGMKYKEVAEILNISPRTVETQLMRAMAKLNKILSPYVSSGKDKSRNKIKLQNIIKTLFF